MTALGWVAGIVLLCLMAASLAATMRAVTDQQARRDAAELDRRRKLNAAMGGDES